MNKKINFNSKNFDYLVDDCIDYNWFETEKEAIQYAHSKEQEKLKTIVLKMDDYWFVFSK